MNLNYLKSLYHFNISVSERVRMAQLGSHAQPLVGWRGELVSSNDSFDETIYKDGEIVISVRMLVSLLP